MNAACRLALLLVLAAVVASCAPPADEPVGSSAARIVYGTPDTTHTAVVAIIAADNTGVYGCTGTIVQMTGITAYILTAAHCCSDPVPSLVVTGADCQAGYDYIQSGGTMPSNVYAIVPDSISADPLYDGNANYPVHDFCMLKAIMPAGTPAIPVATGSDGLSVGVTVEYVGYGVTQTNQNNSLCEHASAPVDQSVTSTYFQYTEGGTTHIGGPCEGDSGGPALLPAGAAQSQQKVVGTTSYGDQNCRQYGVSMRVTSATGAGGFISNYLATAPITDGGTVQSDAGTTQHDAGTTQHDGGTTPSDGGGFHFDSGAGTGDGAGAGDGSSGNHGDGGGSQGGGGTGGGSSRGCAVSGAGAGGAAPWLVVAIVVGATVARRSRRGRA